MAGKSGNVAVILPLTWYRPQRSPAVMAGKSRCHRRLPHR